MQTDNIHAGLCLVHKARLRRCAVNSLGGCGCKDQTAFICDVPGCCINHTGREMDHIVPVSSLTEEAGKEVPAACSPSTIIQWITLYRKSGSCVPGYTPEDATSLLNEALFGTEPTFQTACRMCNLFKGTRSSIQQHSSNNSID